MTLTALLVSVGVGTCAFVEGTAKAPPVPIAGTVVDADRRPASRRGDLILDPCGRQRLGWLWIVGDEDAF
jgi:hypothetical protein